MISVGLGWWDSLEAEGYDLWFRVRGQQAPPADIVIIGIDDESLARYGRWPWGREIHAALLEKLAGARLVGFDLTFNSSGTAEEDARLAKAIREHGRVVLPAHFSFEKDGQDVIQVLRPPVGVLLRETFSLGFVNFPTEQDNVVRTVTPVTQVQGRPFPAFSLAMALGEQGLAPSNLEIRPDQGVTAGNLLVPRPGGKAPFINFWGPAQTFTTVPYYQVLDGTVSPEFFAGKTVLIGPVSPLLKDALHTPFTQGNMVLKGALPAPGVELHATALASFRNGLYFYPVPLMVNTLLVALFGGAAYLLTANRKPLQGLVILFLLIGVWVVVNWLLWWQMHTWVYLVAPMVTALLAYLGATVFNLVRVDQERKRIKGMFGRYVSPGVVDQLLKNPEMIKLGGQRLAVTVLFSDIRGFTSYSEGKQPEEIVARLNEYFSRMTAIVFKHNGTLDKFLGDGLMAVFGIPIPTQDHAGNALAAAKEMCVALHEMNAVWVARGEPVFNLGIGLNSGPVLVGNIGSEERMEYTVIGEEVNLASRLESMNKEYGTRLILSERTLACLNQDREGIVELGAVQVRGMVQPVKIYTLPEVNGGVKKHETAGNRNG